MQEGTLEPRASFPSLGDDQSEANTILRLEAIAGRANVQDAYPLSPLQHGILFHHIENEGHDTYVLSTLFSAPSRRHVNLLAERLQTVINRHDALRTAVIYEGVSQPLQVVYRHVELPVHQISLHPGRDALEQLRTQARSGRYRFDLQSPPLARLWIAHQPHESQWYAVFQAHHMVCDHLSLIEILTETAACLEAREQLLPASIPFKRYVTRALAHTSRAEAEAFFRAKLAGIDSTTAPFGISDARVDGNTIQEHRTNLDPAVAQRLRALAQRHGVSPGRLLHCAWCLVVAHSSGRDDVVFGTVLLAAEQRSRGTTTGVLLGPCINTLPLRLSLREVSVAALVERTSRELSELLAHDAVPLALAQSCSSIRNGSPLFTSLFNFRRGDSQYRVNIASDVGIRVLGMTGTRTGYPITVSVNDSGDGFEIIAQTDHRLSPQRIAGYLEAAAASLLDALDASPQRPALELSILPAAERRLLLEDFNNTSREYPRARAVHQIFEQWAANTPRAVALTAECATLTYCEVNRQANQLAHFLREQGTEVGEYIPVVMHRCATMVIAQLAILKCGCVYLPVDPDFPIERQAFIFRDCAARRVLTGAQAQRFDLPELRWIDVSAARDELSRMPIDNLDLPLVSSSPAYVMYTSGSTGIPKGVVVPHQAVIRLVINSDYVHLSADDCLIHYSNPAFDASTFEIWGALLHGARLVVVPQTTVLDPSAFERVLAREQVSVLWMTVGLFNQYVDTLAGVLRGLRYLIVGGDSLDPKVIARVLRTSPPAKLLNAYGPTEGTTFTTTHVINEVDDNTVCIPIGAPIANTEVYILDTRLQPVPIGVAGELYIGGDGVADGYLNRPELTAERFVADTFGRTPGKKLYRTGDLGRWRPDGAIEFLGRNDHQVKIRGFRVELGEIQARVEQHPAVKEAVVLTRPDETGQKQIVCYLSAKNPLSAPAIDDLREHVRRSLPHYMVPSAFVLLDKLPLNANGKVDRKALPEPELSAYGVDTSEAPQGEFEHRLAALWQNLLGIQRMGRHDNFFELGAHSLHVLQLLMRVKEAGGVPIGVKDVYNCPTIHDLAKRLRGKSLELGHVDLQREAVLPRTIAALPSVCAAPPRNVLVTGGTGFVGRFLLAQLLRDSSATIYCLVRCQSQEHGFAILKDKLIDHDLWRNDFDRRIVAVPGDLRQPNLGINETTYEKLSRTVDSIYHCATSMNHLESYALAKPANVGGAIEVLKLATRHRPKLVNYTSTASVFSATPHPGARSVNERTSIDQELHLTSKGYAASKWVGEKLFMLASERGIPCNIFRLGLIWADTELGRYDELQRDHRILKSCILSGFGIEHYRQDMPPTPVDYAARAILHLASAHPNGDGVFHISSSTHAGEGMFERCNDLMDLSLTIVPLYDWIREIKRLSDQGMSLPVVPLVEYAFSMDERTFYAHHAQRAQIDFDAHRTHAEVERAGIIAPTLSDRVLRLCVERMLSENAQLSQAGYRRSGATGHDQMTIRRT
jgi:amino acid adenylation domain-containing protein/thioester reductase-like protein